MPYEPHEVEGEPTCAMHVGFAMKLKCSVTGEEKWRCDFDMESRYTDAPISHGNKPKPAAKEPAAEPAAEEPAADDGGGGGDY